MGLSKVIQTACIWAGLLLAALPVADAAGEAAGNSGTAMAAGTSLLRAYPDHIAGLESSGLDAAAVLVWRDGTRMPLATAGQGDGSGVARSVEDWLARPAVGEMLRFPYAAGDAGAPPLTDPGRARPSAFFHKMYGDCAKGEVSAQLVDVVWLPAKSGQKLKVTRVNGVAARLQAISNALDALPPRFDVYLKPSAGTYVCRPIAGTSSPSAHGFGIAIDVAVNRAHYWRWSKGGAAAYQNEIPMEIVRIFEAHGFIWGGKWRHYDTMHFEYRPELLPPTAELQK
jgi:D-alanyl-D-alanine carboxypeptidase